MDEHRPIQAIKNEIRLLGQELAAAVAFEEAIKLAYQERTGLELEDGGAYIAEDRARAEEIVLLYPGGKDHT